MAARIEASSAGDLFSGKEECFLSTVVDACSVWGNAAKQRGVNLLDFFW